MRRIHSPDRHPGRGLSATLGFLVTLLPVAAHAQILVVPAAAGEQELTPAREAGARLHAALDGAGAPLVDPAASSRRFEEHASAPPPSVSQSDIDRWLSSSRSAVRNLARADYDAAREDLLEAQELSDRAAEELNRETARARQVLDTCLFMVRSFLETGDSSRAATQARRCRLLVPRVDPSHALHPPEVRELLSRTDRELAAAETASLEVRSAPSGCTVRLNGLDLGTTPYTVRELMPGEYRVQVECDAEQRGRVHRVTLEEGATVLEIDAAFDRSVRSSGGVALAYRSPREAEERRFADALTLGRALSVEEVWLVTPTGGALRADRIDVEDARVVASATVDAGAVEGVVEPLHAGRSVRISGGRAAPASPWQPARVARTDDSPRAEPAPRPAEDGGGLGTAGFFGIGTGVVGLGALAGAWGAYVERGARGDQLAVALPSDPDYLARQQRWIDGRAPMFLLGGAGALALSATAPLLLPAQDGVPWWGWVSGGLGVAVTATGIGLVATSSPCTSGQRKDQRCVDQEHRADLGALVSMHGAPLLAVPVTYLLRSALGPDVSARASVSSRSARLELGGRF